MNSYENIKNELDSKMLNQRANILKVLNGQQKVYLAKEIMSAYTEIYNFIVQGETQGKKMYDLFKNYNETFLNQSEEIVRKSYGTKNFLEETLTEYQMYDYHTRILKSYFAYLDRSFVEVSNNNNTYPLLKQQAKEQYYSLFYSKLFSFIKEEFKTKLKQDRIHIDKEIQLQLQRVYKIIYEMKSISQDKDNREKIQNEIKEDTKNYYQNQYNYFKQQSFLDQIKLLIQFKDEEQSRIKLIFGCEQNDLQKDLIDMFNQNIINNYAEDLYQDKNDTLRNIIFQDYFQQFGQLVQFFDNFKSYNHIFVKKFKDIIIQQGKEIIQERQSGIIQSQKKQDKEEQQNKFLSQLIYLQQSYKNLIKNYGENNQFLFANLNSAFQKITATADQQIIMESFLSRIHTFNSKRIDIEEEKQLSQILQILQCFQSQDLFLKNYQNKLAQRIFTLKDYHLDIDKQIIDQFRKAFGPDHIKSVEIMIKDYEQSLNANQMTISDIEIQAIILKKEFWPELKPYINLDKILILNQLKSAYRQKFNSQQEKNQLVDLTWQDQISMIELKFKTNQEYRIKLGVVSCAILLQFDENNLPLTTEQLQEKINVDSQYFKNQLKILEIGQILIKDDKGYKFNEQFSQSKQSVYKRIYLDQNVDYKQEDIQGDRKTAIQAAIVRIMKGKRTLSFQKLNILVREQLKMFKPEDRDIKEVIENLMNLEYLKRNPQNINELIYVS